MMHMLFLILGSTVPSHTLLVAKMLAGHCMFDEALKEVAQASEEEQRSREGQLLVARFLVQLDRSDEALKVLVRVPTSTISSEEADKQLLLSLALQGSGRLQEAAAAAGRARDLGENVDLVDGVRAMILVRRRKLDDAEALFRAVLRRSPYLTGPLYNLGCLMAMKGDVAEAAALVRQAWFFGLQNGDQLRTDKDLESVRKVPGLIDDLIHYPIPKCTGW